jgi:hypothetical protein
VGLKATDECTGGFPDSRLEAAVEVFDDLVGAFFHGGACLPEEAERGGGASSLASIECVELERI